MDLSSLRIFQAVAQAGSVTRAAERLHCVQPNVTARIRQLEQELGAALFNRKPRGVTLTPAGRTLLRYADRLFELAAEASEALREETEARDVLTVGCTMAFAACRLPGILRRFLAAHPLAQAIPATDASQKLVERVLAFELDGAFVNGAVEHPRLEGDVVFEDELVLATGRDAPAPRDMPRRVALAFACGCAYRVNLEYWLHRSGLAPYEVLEVGSLEGILGCVASGLGFTLLPRHVAENCRQAEALRLEPLPGELGRLPVVFVRRLDSVRSRGLAALLEAAREEARSAAPRGALQAVI